MSCNSDFRILFSAVASDPLLISLTQTSATSVIVEWSQPSGGATVTGYVVNYRYGATNMTQSVPPSSASTNIGDLQMDSLYTFSVEATSEHLSGESDNCTITLSGNVFVSTSHNSVWGKARAEAHEGRRPEGASNTHFRSRYYAFFTLFGTAYIPTT